LAVEDQLVPTVNSGPNDKNLIALTFDDGPHPSITPKILEELRKRKIRATFFVLGDRVKKYPWIVQQIVAEGHELGNHTFNHKLLTELPIDAVDREITETQNEIKKLTGYETSLFRPPYGAMKAETKLFLREKNFTVVLWSVDPRDWQVRNSDRILTHVINNTRNGSIILCHDINKSTLEALPDMLDLLIEMGYEFATVNQLCNLPALKLVSTK
jgi:peptidoglycan-N-acetylglucosamine deacetylase